MKSEPDDVSIDDLAAAPGQTLPWHGVRNAQARNFMRERMTVGDRVLFYHSSCAVPGIVGLASVASPAHPDATQFDPASPYADPTSNPEAPRWWCVDVRFERKLSRPLTLAAMRATPGLASMIVLRRGNRLSITPVDDADWQVLEPLLC